MNGDMSAGRLRDQINMLSEAIADAHVRMATNRDPEYRAVQQEKVNAWLERLTVLYEEHEKLWIEVV